MTEEESMSSGEVRVSVIIPVYRVEKYIDACLMSVREQTLKNLEILCIDDCGGDGSVDKIRKMAAEDGRIRLYSNEKNGGLAFSRNRGLSLARGKYVYFLDSDDMITRTAMEELCSLAEREELDAAVFTADFIYENEELKAAFSSNPAVFKGDYPETCSGRALYIRWMQLWDWMPSQPRFFYRRSFLEREKIRFISGMLHEDETFAFDVLMKADRIRVVPVPYFIRRFRAGSIMTGTVTMKNVEGCLTILRHVSEYQERHRDDAELADAISFYKGKIEKNARGKLKAVLAQDPQAQMPADIGLLSERPEAVSEESVKVVSFDLFDTLLVRPVPGEDVRFSLLDDDFYRLTGSYVPFSGLRTKAEAILRRRILRGEGSETEKWEREKEGSEKTASEEKVTGKTETGNRRSGIEEISLDDIYGVLQEVFQVSPACAAFLKEKEEQLDEQLCRPRAYGKRLYEKARTAGKRIVITSDMYVSRAAIERLLKKNGYEGWEDIFLSSQRGKRKITGNLYRELIRQTGEAPEHILHIGDNLVSDVEMALRCGIRACYVPAAMTAFEGRGCMSQTKRLCRDLVDWEKASKETGIRVFRQMAANRYFDDPFRPFDPETDYNRDPWFLGYAALGPQLLSLVKWIAEQSRRDQAEAVFFLSRDGYLPMKAYQLYRACHPELAKEAYLYGSRIAFLPAMIRSPQDLFDLPVDLHYQTPEKLLKRLRFCTESDEESGWMRPWRGKKALDADTYAAFIRDFLTSGYDARLHRQSLDRIRLYLFEGNEIPLSEKTAVFDMGYSGRIPAAMSYAAGLDFPVYYFHGDGSGQFHARDRSGIRLRTFLDFNPYMESTLREYAYLETAPSCVGYDECLCPVFDRGPAPGYAPAAEAMQKGALEFVSDFLAVFGGREEKAPFRYLSAALPFEAFLRHCSEKDKAIYENVLIDDELWGGRRDIDLKMLMETRLSKLPDYAG